MQKTDIKKPPLLPSPNQKTPTKQKWNSPKISSFTHRFLCPARLLVLKVSLDNSFVVFHDKPVVGRKKSTTYVFFWRFSQNNQYM